MLTRRGCLAASLRQHSFSSCAVSACSTRRSLTTSSRGDGTPPRLYKYTIDVHGQLFLHDTVPKNLTSCFKDNRFLNFFYDRVVQVPIPAQCSKPPTPPQDNWHEDSEFLASLPEPKADSVFALARSQGYNWLSECQGEWNLIKLQDPHGTPIVFRELARADDDSTDRLRWAGDRYLNFQPEKLKVCRESGYLYHPSPFPATAKWQRRLDKHLETQASSPFGNYSLLSSDLVLSHFAAELDVDENGGTVAWRDKQWHVLPLQAGDLKR